MGQIPTPEGIAAPPEVDATTVKNAEKTRERVAENTQSVNGTEASEVSDGLKFEEAMELANELEKGDHKSIKGLMELLIKEDYKMLRLVKFNDNTLGAAPIEEGQRSPITVEQSIELAELINGKIDREKMKAGQQKLAEKKEANKKAVEENEEPPEKIIKSEISEERKEKIEIIKKELASIKESTELLSYVREIGRRYGVVQIVGTGQGKNDWKVVATEDKEGSEIVAKAMMDRKREIENSKSN